MLAEVTLLRRAGMRLRTTELEPPVRGDLRIADDDGRSSFRRVMKVATLHRRIEGTDLLQDVLKPLFGVGPPLLLESGTLTIAGVELSTDAEMRVVESAQVWRCKTVASGP